MYEYQVTIVCTTGQYRPVSCIIKTVEEIDLHNKTAKMSVVNKGIQKICSKRYWTSKDLKRYSYNKIKIRKYDKEAIQLEQIDKYRKIKAQRYGTNK
jgi:hypothetical protein